MELYGYYYENGATEGCHEFSVNIFWILLGLTLATAVMSAIGFGVVWLLARKVDNQTAAESPIEAKETHKARFAEP